MKLSFSTNGWNLDFYSLIDKVKENNIHAVEIHDIDASCFKAYFPFSSGNLSKTVKYLFENDVQVSCIDLKEDLAFYADENVIIEKIKKTKLFPKITVFYGQKKLTRMSKYMQSN